MITDLTKGNTRKLLWTFTIPMLISVMFQQIYNIADSMIAGKFVGEDALAAIGASYPITMIFMAVAIGCNIGCSVVISQLFGGKKYHDMKTAISTTFVSCTTLSIVLTILGLISCRTLIRWINTPVDIFEDAALYLKIYIAGLIFLFLYNICTGIFSALGDSKTPLYFLIASSIGNIILDLVFVIVFDWKVAGVAWATFIAQGISCILSILVLYRRVKSIKTNEKTILFSKKMLGRISAIAIPSILQQSFISIGNIFIQGLVNGYGSSVIAGYSAAIKLNTFAITSLTTLGNGVSSFTAQNIGAGKSDRIKEGFRTGLFLAFSVVVPFFLALFFFQQPLVALFMKEGSEEARMVGCEFLKIVSPFYFVISIKLIADGVLRGAGAMKYFMVATFTDLILRVVLAFILSPIFGARGIWLSWPIGWVVAMLLSFVFYKSGKWKC